LLKEWRIGDKTGSGDFGTTNDVAVIWPPDRKPLIVSVYMTETQTSSDERNAAIARLGLSVAKSLGA
jgi:beta-lactamase class A